jgi:hypothetical protein
MIEQEGFDLNIYVVPDTIPIDRWIDRLRYIKKTWRFNKYREIMYKAERHNSSLQRKGTFQNIGKYADDNLCVYQRQEY